MKRKLGIAGATLALAFTLAVSACGAAVPSAACRQAVAANNAYVRNEVASGAYVNPSTVSNAQAFSTLVADESIVTHALRLARAIARVCPGNVEVFTFHD